MPNDDKKTDKKFFEKQLEDYRDQVWGCARCNWCQNQWGWNVKSAEYSEICPAFHEYRFFPYSGMGKMHIARAMIEGDFDYEDAPELAEFIYTCTTCGACEMNCQRMQDKEPLKVNETLRAQFVKDGIGPMPEHKKLISSVKSYDNPWMQARSQRDRWAKKINLKDASKEATETLFFVGCTTALDPAMLDVARNTAGILLKAEVDLGMLGRRELCCGSPIARVGDRETFISLANRNIELLNSLGIKEIVTSCPGCFRSIKHDYSQIPGASKLNFKVFHTVEYIERLISQGRLKLTKELPMRVTWHDPCHLGRHCGVYEAPRNILKAIPGVVLVEKERIKDQSWCCGGGGGVRTAFLDFAQKTAEKLIEEAQKTTGAEAIVTCCPFCEQNIGDVLNREGYDIKLYNLIEMVAKAME
jgi:Fe-S oxidoreductase